MKPPKSRKAELGPNASGGEKSHAETAESAEFKMTELGPIPKDWEVKRLGEICSEYAYGTGAESVDYDGKNKYIRITDIDEDSHLYSPSTLVSPSFFSEGHIVKDNDLLVARTGASVGKTYFYSKRDGKLIFAGFLMKANVKHAEGKFIFYWTLTDYYKRWVLSESARSGQPGINIRQLQSLLLPLPPLAEQRRIARALSDVDELISALGKLIDKKRNIKTGAMQELLGMRNEECGMRNVPRRRLPGFSGEWVEKRLGDYAIVARGGSPRPIEAFLTSHNDGLNWVKIGDVGVGAKYIERTAEKILPSGLSSTRMVYPGDFLLSNSMSFGRPYIMKITGCIHDGWLVIQDYKTTFDTEYLYYVLGSEMVVNQYRVLAAGSSVLNLNKDVVASVTVVVPPTLAEQKAIAAVLSDMDAEIAALEAKRAKYESIKQGMMQELLTGKTRLKGE